MAKPSIPTTLPASLSPAVAPLSLTTGVGSIWDLGIDGVGFMLSTLDVESPFEFRSYEVQSIPTQKPRIDDADEPGEQTLAAWWSRAQHSWHEGAGQHVFDSPFSSRFRFCQSFRINIWDDGQFSLLRDTEQLRSDSVDDHHLLVTESALFYTYNGNLKRDPNPDTVAEGNEDELTTFNGLPVDALTSDGESIYASIRTQGIEKCPINGVLGWTHVNDLLDVEILKFVKGRLIGARTDSLYEFDLSTTDAPEPFYTDPVQTWEWTGITEAGPAIYFSGRAGDRSEIFAARLTAQDIPFASVATLGAIRSVWTAPEGETVRSIKGYLGKQILIGTNLGVRIGTISTGEGDIEVSPLITSVEHGGDILGTQHPVLDFDPQFEFAYFGWTRFDGTYSGVGRIHLGDLSYASDVMFASQGEVTEVAVYNDRIYFVIDEGATSRIVKEHATRLAPNGWIQNCEMRFGTTERKTIRYFDILTQSTGKWSLEVSQNGGALVAYTTDNPASGYQEEILDLEATRFGNRITLTRDDVDNTKGPIVLEWRFRAEPRAKGRFRYFVPMMVYDQLELQNGATSGKNGQAMEMLNHLKNLYRLDSDIVFQGPETGIPGAPPPQLVKMEDLRFKEYAPPEQGMGFGGIALAIFREVR